MARAGSGSQGPKRKAPRKRGAKPGAAASGRRRGGAARGWRRYWTPRHLRAAGRVVAALAFVAGFAAATWVVRLDRIVVARFEGERFRVPSKVLSAPTILYPGLDHRRLGLRESLVRLGYRERPPGGPLPVGSFLWSERRVRVHLRAFEHPTRAEPEREIVIALGPEPEFRIG